MLKYICILLCGEVAQLGRVLGLGPSGRRFESCLLHHGEVAQLVRARGSYPRGHEFDPHLRYHMDQLDLILGPIAQLVRALGS